NGGNLLIAMFREPDSYAVFLLQEQGITRFDLVNYISHGISKIAATEEWSQSEDEQGEEEKPGRRGKTLEAFAVNLVAKAQQGKVDPRLGREDEIEGTDQLLLR